MFMVIKLTFYGGVGAIGGNKVLLETEDGCVLLDFGRQMNLHSQYFSEFLQVRSKNALRDLLRLGVLPKINGIYTPWLVDMTALFDEGVAGKVPVGEAVDYWKSVEVQPCNPEQPSVDGVFVSHAHFDHIQDVSFLDPSIPIYCTEKTRILSKAMADVSPLGVDDQYYKLAKEAKIKQKQSDPRFDYKILCPMECVLLEDKEEERPVIFDPKTKFSFTYEVAPKTRTFNTALEGSIKGITYKLIPVGHSVPGACSVLLTLPDGRRILYTGDIRFHGAGEVTIDDYVNAICEGVDVMITEGTRIESENILTETQVGRDITQDIHRCSGLVLISFGWKDLTRFNTVYEAAKANNRTLAITPKLAYLLYEMHHNFPQEYPDPRKMGNLKVYLRREGDLLYSATDYDKWELGYLHFHGRNMSKEDQNLIRIAEHLCVGGAENNYGKPLPENDGNCNYQDIYDLALSHLKHGVRAYEIRQKPQQYVLMFSFWDANELFDLIPQKGNHDTRYISASTEPFSEEMEIDETKMFQWMKHFKINYDTEKDKEVFKRRHVSGHAAKPELQEVINKINPKILIPIHTEKPEKFKDIYQGNIIYPDPERAQTITL
jgi:ribonuclease J